MVGLETSAHNFFVYYATLCCLNCVTLGMFVAIGAVSPNLKVAQMIAPMTIILFALFGYVKLLDVMSPSLILPSGFYANNDSLPVYYVWIKVISFVRYCFEIVVCSSMS